jgi:hypothetical protein
MLQVNEEFVGPLDEGGLDRLLDRLRADGNHKRQRGAS